MRHARFDPRASFAALPAALAGCGSSSVSPFRPMLDTVAPTVRATHEALAVRP